MRRLRKFVGLSFAVKRRLFQTAFLLIGVRVALRLFKFEDVRRTLLGYSQPQFRAGHPPPTSNEIIWAVNTTSRFLLPKKPCLTKALVAQMLLSRSGYTTTLRIGVARTDGSGLQAHAWLEDHNRIVVGYLDNLAMFTPLPPLESPGT